MEQYITNIYKMVFLNLANYYYTAQNYLIYYYNLYFVNDIIYYDYINNILVNSNHPNYLKSYKISNDNKFIRHFNEYQLNMANFKLSDQQKMFSYFSVSYSGNEHELTSFMNSFNLPNNKLDFNDETKNNWINIINYFENIKIPKDTQIVFNIITYDTKIFDNINNFAIDFGLNKITIIPKD